MLHNALVSFDKQSAIAPNVSRTETVFINEWVQVGTTTRLKRKHENVDA